MTDKPTLGDKLIALKERSGLTLSNIAKAAGYRSPSSIQRYFSPDYDAEYLPGSLAAKLEEALIGYGDPLIVRDDIVRLTEIGFMLDRQYIHPARVDLRRRVQTEYTCSGTYPSGSYRGEAEEFVINDAPLAAFAAPAHLALRHIEALYVTTTSMAPRYGLGEVVFFDTDRPASIGEDVVVWLKSAVYEDSDTNRVAILGRFVGRSRAGVEIEVLTPPSRFVIEAEEINAVMPILAARELLPDA
ncbi:conserved hypothetical protein [Sphingomonas sp. T1]|uniref:hypothetical protein n=1 Tax=Sphingomonas sp. T1 TaxID=2653172 RepID=UPI0012F18CDE|nr:hypothetical protein [Sphingomonas sp. T1]VXD07597.1 conserved hypothetical protein [Sphingomonas sp. T1]